MKESESAKCPVCRGPLKDKDFETCSRSCARIKYLAKELKAR